MGSPRCLASRMLSNSCTISSPILRKHLRLCRDLVLDLAVASTTSMLLAQALEDLGSLLHQDQDAIAAKSSRSLSKTMNREQITLKTMKTRSRLTQDCQDRTTT